MTYDKETQDKELILRIKTILLLRVIFLTGFVIMVLWFQQQTPDRVPIAPLSITIAIAYLFSLIYVLLLKYGSNLLLLASFQTAGDLTVVGGVVFSTGGIESPLSFLYSLVIIATAVLLPRAASFLTASVASISYGLLIDLEYYNVISPVYFFLKSRPTYEGGYVFYLIFVNIMSFYAVAYLSSLLSHRLRLVKEQLALTSSNFYELQAFHQNVVQNMGNGLLTADLDGRVTSMNPAAESITGVSLADGLNQYCHHLLPIPQFGDFFVKKRFSFLPQYIEGECRRKDGKTIFIRIRMSRLMDNQNQDQMKGFICVFEDLTEIRAMEGKIAQSEQLAALGRFSAGLAHEIRNPLASLSGSIQVLYKGLNLEGSYLRLMEIVLRETDRLNRIVTDFLHYSHSDKNQHTLVDLTQLVQDVITLMKNSDEYHPSIFIEFAPRDNHLLISGNEQRFKQLVWNLCLNGIQSMSSAGTLRIHLNPAEGFRHQTFQTSQTGIVLIVEDQGCGIASNEIKKMFDLFYTTKVNGVGLGLATVQQIVNEVDGYIGVESEIGKGTRFSVFLPHSEPPLPIRQAPASFS
jgi:two-component system sensor histidine kinase PilS (NtrC family)